METIDFFMDDVDIPLIKKDGMKIPGKILKWLLYVLFIPISYVIIALILTFITVNRADISMDNSKEIYLTTNGVHLDIIIPVDNLSIELKEGLKFAWDDRYFSFGWGDENFYLNTPTWKDLTFKNAFKAMIIKSSALIHLTRYKQIRTSWTKVNVSESELKKLNQFVTESFKKDVNGNKIILTDSGYSVNDDFYKANGSFYFFHTCNSWVNKAFKESGLRSCLWTPFDFGLIDKYE